MPERKKHSSLGMCLAFLFAVSGCGGGGGGGQSPSSTNNYSGVAIDGNLSNARAFLDLNGNGTFDSGEPVAITGSDGTYSISATADQIASHSIVVDAIAGQTVDQDEPSTAITQAFSLIAPIGRPEVVSPLTTQVVAKVNMGLSISAAQTAVQQELGLTNVDVMANYVARKTTDNAYADAHKVAASIAEVLKTVEAESTSNTSLANRLAATVSKVSTQVAPAVSSIKQASSIADARTVVVNIIQTASNIYSVGGRIIGLSSDGLVLSSGTGTASPLAGSRTFTLPNLQSTGSAYDLKIQAQPLGQICSVANGAGNVANQSITSIEVTCVNNSSVGGVISGLTTNGLVLKNGGEELAVQAGASSFKFTTDLALGDRYLISIQAQPTGRTCSVSNGFGDMPANGANNVVVTCSINSYYVGGGITGLASSGLRLESGGETLDVSNGATYFSFTRRTALGGAYSVRVQNQPSGLTCTVGSGSGNMGAADVTSVSISCSPISYSLSGSISGLTATGLKLKTGQELLAVTANSSSFVFTQKLAFNSNYAVTIDSQPDGLFCSANNSTGSMPASDVSTVQVSCIKAPPQLLLSPDANFTLNITTINFKVKTNNDSYGYWAVMPAAASTPTVANIKALLTVNPPFSKDQAGTFNGVKFIGGTDLLRAGEIADITLTDLNFSTNYKLYFVAALQNSLLSTTNVVAVSFSTPAAAFVEVDPMSASGINDLRQCGYHDGYQYSNGGIACLNTDRTQSTELVTTGQFEQTVNEVVTKNVSSGTELKRQRVSIGDRGLALTCSGTSLVYVSTSQGLYTYNRRTDEVTNITSSSFPVGLDGLGMGAWEVGTVFMYKKAAADPAASWCPGHQPFYWGGPSTWSYGVWKMRSSNP